MQIINEVTPWAETVDWLNFKVNRNQKCRLECTCKERKMLWMHKYNVYTVRL